MMNRPKTFQVSEREIEEALTAARDTLNDLALQSPLNPDGDRARERCNDVLEQIERAKKARASAFGKAARRETPRNRTKNAGITRNTAGSRGQQATDGLRREQSTAEDAFDQIAMSIAQVDIPLSKAAPSEGVAQGYRGAPTDWINNYADGLARSGEVSHHQAVAGIRSAFEDRYGKSPEAYAKQWVPRQANEGKAAQTATRKPKQRYEKDQGRERGE